MICISVQRIQISHATREEFVKSKRTYDIVERGFVDIFVSIPFIQSKYLSSLGFVHQCPKEDTGEKMLRLFNKKTNDKNISILN